MAEGYEPEPSVPAIDGSYTYHSLEEWWNNSRYYTIPITGFYTLAAKGEGAGGTTTRWGIGGNNWFFATQTPQMVISTFYFKAGTVLWTRDMTGTGIGDTYGVIGYWSK